MEQVEPARSLMQKNAIWTLQKLEIHWNFAPIFLYFFGGWYRLPFAGRKYRGITGLF